MRLSVMSWKKRSTMFSHDGPVGVACTMRAAISEPVRSFVCEA
jgi:hypothetical protein